MLRDWDRSREGGRAGRSLPARRDDAARACLWRREQGKINQKINKTLKSLQSTEQDPAASSSSVDEAESEHPAGKAEHTPHRNVGIFFFMCA